jgi:hypothetical protein
MIGKVLRRRPTSCHARNGCAIIICVEATEPNSIVSMTSIEVRFCTNPIVPCGSVPDNTAITPRTATHRNVVRLTRFCFVTRATMYAKGVR